MQTIESTEQLSQQEKIQALRQHLQEGAEQARKGQLVKDFSTEKLIEELDRED